MTNSLPWTVLTDGAHIVDPNGWTVAYCYGDAAAANARLIITAANTHAELLAAAKLVCLTYPNHFNISPSLMKLEAAIAKVEELVP